MENKVSFKELRNASIFVDNSVDTSKVYDIESNVNIGVGKQVQSYDSGNVRKSGNQVAIFSCYGGRGSLSISFMQTEEQVDQVAILEAINAFMDNVEESAGSLLSSILAE